MIEQLKNGLNKVINMHSWNDVLSADKRAFMFNDYLALISEFDEFTISDLKELKNFVLDNYSSIMGDNGDPAVSYRFGLYLSALYTKLTGNRVIELLPSNLSL